jgi:hypothetical protein
MIHCQLQEGLPDRESYMELDTPKRVFLGK